MVILCFLLCIVCFVMFVYVLITKNRITGIILLSAYGLYTPFIVLFIACVIVSFITKNSSIYRMGNSILFRYGLELRANFDEIPKTPCIFVCNYCAKDNVLNYLAHTLFPCKLSLVVQDAASVIINRVYEKDELIYTARGKNKNYQRAFDGVKDRVSKGYYIFAYSEASSGELYKISKLKSGMFSIAKELGVPIVPVVMDSISNWHGLFTRRGYRIKLGKPFFVQNVEEDVKNVKRWMQKNLNIMAIRY